MTSRSSIYRMHEERQQAMPAASAPSLIATSSYNNGVSFGNMTSKSTIYQRNARRAARHS
eukprot:CAMPEP_0116555102 /NCGR_PEP_ID=MMETSP0397-20121206/7967_1 /TAXON_ID=216820 /ORGANISM="Cyclophora tenuis, Strain ECT3854" /LENGTH=59 /DNA_ID=CAMNT_0004080349 /DNA_START=216 /DNA_END=395 /DNA_ORIENTATION=+